MLCFCTSFIFSTHEYQAALEESRSLLVNATKLLTNDGLHVQVLKGAICLVLLAVTKTNIAGCSDVNSLSRNPAFVTIRECVTDWIQNSKVVGGKRFGGAQGHSRTVTEIKVSIVSGDQLG